MLCLSACIRSMICARCGASGAVTVISWPLLFSSSRAWTRSRYSSRYLSGLNSSLMFSIKVAPSSISSSDNFEFSPLAISAKFRTSVPMWVHVKTKEPFAFAGLWDVWRKSDGGKVESFTIITTEPNDLIEAIHNRMPVILRPEDEEPWLDVFRTTFIKARSVLKPLPAELMDAHDVSPIVNSAKYDGA